MADDPEPPHSGAQGRLGSLQRLSSGKSGRSSKALDDLVQTDAINQALGKKDKEGSERILDIPRWNIRVDGRKFSKWSQKARRKPRRTLLLLPVADPCSRFATYVAITNTITDMIYTSYFVALSMAFNDYSRINAWTIIDLIGSCIYVVDIVAEFHIGFMVRWDNESVIIRDGWEVFKYYTLRSSFFIDFVASLPIIIQITFLVFPAYASNASAVRVLQLLRLLRMLRVLNLIRRMGRVGQGGSMGTWLATKLSPLTMFLLRIIFTFTVLLNLMACLWWWIAVTEGGQNSWVYPLSISKPELNLYNETTGELTNRGADAWLVCAYYSLVTMSTIGYGDITPVTYAEIGLVLIFVLLGVSYFGYVISSVSEIAQMSRSSEMDQAELLEKLRGVEVWMKRNGFGKKIRQEVRHYFNTTYLPKSDAERESQYYDSLPLWLRTKVLKSIISNSDALELFTGIRMHPLSLISKVVIKAIAASAVPLHLRAGERVFSRGEEANHVFLLEEGEVGSLIPGETEPFVVQAPGVLGSSSVFSEKIPICGTRPLTAFAQTPATVWRIDGKDVYNRLLAWAPISLVHILDSYMITLERCYSYYDSRSRQGYYVDQVKFSEMYEQIHKEAAELRQLLVEASKVHFQKDVEMGVIDVDGIDHKSFYNILNRKTPAAMPGDGDRDIDDDDDDDDDIVVVDGDLSPMVSADSAAPGSPMGGRRSLGSEMIDNITKLASLTSLPPVASLFRRAKLGGPVDAGRTSPRVKADDESTNRGLI